MSKPLTGVLIVLSNPVAGLEDEYNAWYTDVHLPEVVALDGIQTAQRFKLDDVQVPDTPNDFSYLATYGVSAPPEEFVDELLAGNFELPDSFDQTNLRTFNFAAITGVVGRRTSRSGRVWLALTNPVAGAEDDFNAWYDDHLEEVVELDAFDAAQRFRLTRNQVPADILPPSEHRYAALYDVTVPGDELFGAIADAGFAAPPSFDEASSRFLLFKAITGVVTQESAARKTATR